MSGKINELVEGKKRPLLDKMIDEGKSAAKCVEWCKENRLPLSIPTMYAYIKWRNEAIVNGLTIELLQPN
ncbi:hypothetical protein [Paenibacillus elgii]|uniref:hypothetical protein n=1 Tax=Paenibacillus elgii TaxID=189691 RepID=UPI001953D9B4|nr:hypothetical protein [Paenibacillus elgii]